MWSSSFSLWEFFALELPKYIQSSTNIASLGFANISRRRKHQIGIGSVNIWTHVTDPPCYTCPGPRGWKVLEPRVKGTRTPGSSFRIPAIRVRFRPPLKIQTSARGKDSKSTDMSGTGDSVPDYTPLAKCQRSRGVWPIRCSCNISKIESPGWLRSTCCYGTSLNFKTDLHAVGGSVSAVARVSVSVPSKEVHAGFSSLAFLTDCGTEISRTIVRRRLNSKMPSLDF